MVSIVIPNYFILGNEKSKYAKDEILTHLYRPCIRRIKQFTKDYELILIDNGSHFGSEEIRNDATIYLHNETNLGFGKACNQGFRVAKGEWIICMNNDVFVYEGWVEALLQTFEVNENCGFAMPALLQHTKDAIEADKIEDIQPYLKSNRNRYGKTHFGSLWMTSKEILDKVKKDDCVFDENFNIGMREDKDLFLRIEKELGLLPIKTHNTRVFHQGNCTIAKIQDWKEATAGNRIYFNNKWNIKEGEMPEFVKEIKVREEKKKEVEIIPEDTSYKVKEQLPVESYESKEIIIQGSDGKPKSVKEKRIAILTTFAGYDPGYALHVGCFSRAKMMHEYGLNFDVLVQENYKADFEFPHQKAVIPKLKLRKWEQDSKQVEENVKILKEVLTNVLKDYDIVITHDLIYQQIYMCYNIVINELTQTLPHIKWLHWIHSGPSFPVETEKYPAKLLHTLPKNSKIVYMNETDALRIAESYTTELKNVNVVYNTKDVRDFFNFSDEVSKLINDYDLLDADIMQTFPFSTPRHQGKQIEKVIRLFGCFKNAGQKVKLVLVNAHANNNEDKVKYIRECATKAGLGPNEVIITSQVGYIHGLSRRSVSNLFQISDLFVFPSTSEVCPNVLLEASIAGNLLVINESLPCLKEFCDHKALGSWGFSSVYFNVNYENPKAEEKWYNEVAKIIIGEIYKSRTYHTRKYAFQHFNFKYVFEKQFLPMISEI